MTYTSLEQRLAQNYLCLLAPFVPDRNAPVNTDEQERLYNLMKNLYQLAFDEPLLFVAQLHEDDAYPNRFNKKSYGKPELQRNVVKFTKSIDMLLEAMFLMGKGEEYKLTKKQAAVLSRLGIVDFSNLPPEWIWLSTREAASLASFSYCLFDRDYPYTSEIYARLLGEAGFKKLESWMLSNGYKRFDIYDVVASNCRLSLTIANPKWNSNLPTGGFEYKVKHTGISARFEPHIKDPVVFGLCIPNGLKPYLEDFAFMDKELQDFVVKHTKKCDKCGYCVQTDKSKTRPLAIIPVDYDGNVYSLCTYFPGYNYCWTNIDDNLADELIMMLSFLDRYAPQ